MPCDESWIYCYDPETKRQEFPAKACWLSQTQEGQTNQITPETFDVPFFFYSTGMIYMHWVTTGQTVNKDCYVEILREISSEEASTLQIGSVTFPPRQCTSPQLHPCHRLFDQDGVSRQFLSLPIVQILLPVTFWLFLKLRGCRYETIEVIKEAVTKVIDTLTQEDLNGTFQKLLERYSKCILQPEENTSKGTRISYVYCQ